MIWWWENLAAMTGISLRFCEGYGQEFIDVDLEVLGLKNRENLAFFLVEKERLGKA